MNNRKIYFFFSILVLLWLPFQNLCAAGRLAVLPWQYVGDEKGDRRIGEQIQEALAWAIRNDFNVDILKPSKVKSQFTMLGFDTRDNWNLKRSGEFLRSADCDFLLLGRAFRSGGNFSGSVVLLKRDGYENAKVIFKERIIGRPGEFATHGAPPLEKQRGKGAGYRGLSDFWPVRDYINKIVEKFISVFPRRNEDRNFPGSEAHLYQDKFLYLDIAWLVDTSGSMSRHRKSILQSLSRVWYNYGVQSTKFKLRFAIKAFNGNKNSHRIKPELTTDKSAWRAQADGLVFRGKGEKRGLEEALEKVISNLAWKGQSVIKIVMVITDDAGLGRGSPLGRISAKLRDNKIHVMGISYPGMDKDGYVRFAFLAGKTDGMLGSVIFVGRGFGAQGRIDLAYHGGNWFRFRGHKSMFGLEGAGAIRKRLKDVDKIYDKNPWKKKGQKNWIDLGYYPTKNPDSVFGRVGIFKKYKKDEKFLSKHDGPGLPLYVLDRWFKKKFPQWGRERTEKILIQDSEMAAWIKVPASNGRLVKKILLLQESGIYSWLGCSIKVDAKNKLGYAIRPDSVRIIPGLTGVPDLYKIGIKDPVANPALFSRGGLGLSKIWFFPVKIKSMGSKTKDDLRDY